MAAPNFDRWCSFTRDIESPDTFIRWGFIHLVGAALQRRVWYYPDEDTMLPGSFSLFTNMFTALVGPPSTGKGRVIKQCGAAIKSPLMMRQGEQGKLRPLINSSPDKITCERLIESIAEGGTDFIEYFIEKDGKKEKRTAGQSSCDFLIEELEVLFSKNASDMVNVLNQCYDAGDLNYETRHQGKMHVKNVCVNMLCGTTPEAIRSLLTEKVIKTGFTSRVIAVYAPGPRFYKVFPGITEAQRKDFIELVLHLKHLATKVAGEIKLSPEADAYHKEIYESGRMMKERPNTDPKLDYYYGRKRVHWLKLAAILHFSERYDTNLISLASMQEAYQTLNATEVNMHEAFRSSGRNELHEVGQAIIRFIREKGEVRYKALWFKFSNEVTKEELDNTLGMLIGTEQLVNTNQSTSAVEKGIFEVHGVNGHSFNNPSLPVEQPRNEETA